MLRITSDTKLFELTTEPIFCWSVSHDNIYVVNENREYEIWVYDFNLKNSCLIFSIKKVFLSEEKA